MQVDIMIWFQGLFEGCTGFFDVFFAFITFFGEELAMFILLPILYWVINKEAAHVVALSGFAALTVNGAIKDIAKVERPIGNPDIRFVEIENFFVDTVHLKEGSYSFPSGHSQTTSSVVMALACYYNNKKMWIFSIALTILVMLSRLYLGVHWPLDVLVGGLLGTVFAFGSYKVFKKYNPSIRSMIYLGVAIVSMLCLIVAEKSDTYKAVGACLGFALGVLFEKKYVNFDPKEGTVLRKVLRCLLGVVIVAIFKEGLKPLFKLISDSFFMDFIRYGLLVFVAIALYPWLFKKIKL